MNKSSLLFALPIAAIAAATSLFVVPQTKQALVLQFGQPKRIINQDGLDPGLKIRVPITENVVLFERRILDLQPNSKSEIVTADQERLEVNSFVRWRITDPLRFYQRVRTETVARARLESLLEASMRNVLGSSSSSDIISGRRAALMAEIKRVMNVEARDWGLVIVDVKIRAADLPQANEERVFQRMRSEREQAAAQVRANGDRKAQEVRGAADQERAKILADAYNQDPDFAAFYRSMQAYDKAFPEGTNIVISPDSDFFRYFKSRKGQ
ncbi:protease modulator HflC [Pseudaquidulcibacter saccharophilus]|uniref:protease modulator HflC n=1 Tax=Pseudaquidulcibacter saccharophilus TaxID=2831900 RepID=UPI001EFF4BBB|nr:protease modulator HflC [Pseudaquidulcibacter saccharophilus]